MTEQPRGPRPLPRNAITLTFHGLAYPFSALGFIRRHGLWGLTTAAIGVNVVLLIALVVLTTMYAVPYVEGLVGGMEAWAAGSSWLEPLVMVLGWVVWLASGVLILAVNAVVLLMVGQAVASPFLDMLSERVENIVLASEPQPFSVRRTIESIVVAIADLVWGLVYWALVHVPILMLSLVPVLGTAVAGVLSFAFTALLLAHEFVGLSLSRQLVSYRGRWRVVWSNKSLGLGFGASAMLLLMIPGLNLLLLPLAAVGGTLLYCDLRAGERLNLPK